MNQKCDICDKGLPNTIIVSKCISCNHEHEIEMMKQELERVKDKLFIQDFWGTKEQNKMLKYYKERLNELIKECKKS